MGGIVCGSAVKPCKTNYKIAQSCWTSAGEDVFLWEKLLSGSDVLQHQARNLQTDRDLISAENQITHWLK